MPLPSDEKSPASSSSSTSGVEQQQLDSQEKQTVEVTETVPEEEKQAAGDVTTETVPEEEPTAQQPDETHCGTGSAAVPVVVVAAGDGECHRAKADQQSPL